MPRQYGDAAKRTLIDFRDRLKSLFHSRSLPIDPDREIAAHLVESHGVKISANLVRQWATQDTHVPADLLVHLSEMDDPRLVFQPLLDAIGKPWSITEQTHGATQDPAVRSNREGVPAPVGRWKVIRVPAGGESPEALERLAQDLEKDLAEDLSRAGIVLVRRPAKAICDPVGVEELGVDDLLSEICQALELHSAAIKSLCAAMSPTSSKGRKITHEEYPHVEAAFRKLEDCLLQIRERLRVVAVPD